MPVTVIPTPLFTSPEAVKLGRFITNIEEPNEAYYEPPLAAEDLRVLTNEFTFTGHQKSSYKGGFGSTLASLLSVNISKRVDDSAYIAQARAVSYALDNSEAWFDKAVDLEGTQRWIERAALRGRRIYMIVGIQTLHDPHVIMASSRGSEVKGQVSVPVALAATTAGVVVPAFGGGTDTDPSLLGDHTSLMSGKSEYIAPGERVCALQYRKVGYRWMSSKVVDTLRLSKTRRWSCMEGEMRTAHDLDEEDEDGEDVMVVELDDEEDPIPSESASATRLQQGAVGQSATTSQADGS
ncbi:hypothetical protein NLG97_g3865 [Lecanicillium saksenae]|uniref:Uncharacterized protein n=1 Tax=Lecanicillium saksenae TaxID=468837 RepID=A0ACC1QZI8_9HYPO|nr:hypothetical protein NLG97_g3865 [Lecanicillium saksenae]